MALNLPYGFYYCLYNAGINLLSLFASGILNKRIKQNKEDADRVGERFAISKIARPDVTPGKFIWFHGASVGETAIGLGLAQKLREKDKSFRFLFTSQTKTAADIIQKRMRKGDIHQYFPLDKRSYVKKFLNHWRPDAAIFLEGEIWVNMLAQLQFWRIHHYLLNARMTAKTIANWQKYPSLSHKLFADFNYIHAANQKVANAIEGFGYAKPIKFGNLKTASSPLKTNPQEIAALGEAIGNRKIWLAASTHEGEDELILNAQKNLYKTGEKPLLIIAPRHIERTEAIIALAQKAGFKTAQKSLMQNHDNNIDVYLWDTMGELGNAFKLADICLICGSLIEGIGGHNPIEPAGLECPILSGNYVHNFSDIYSDLKMENAAIIINKPDADKISSAVSELLSDNKKCEEMVINAAKYLAANQSLYQNVLDDIYNLLEGKL